MLHLSRWFRPHSFQPIFMISLLLGIHTSRTIALCFTTVTVGGPSEILHTSSHIKVEAFRGSLTNQGYTMGLLTFVLGREWRETLGMQLSEATTYNTLALSTSAQSVFLHWYNKFYHWIDIFIPKMKWFVGLLMMLIRYDTTSHSGPPVCHSILVIIT